MRDMGRGRLAQSAGAWVITSFSLLGGLGCGVSADDLWRHVVDGEEPPEPPPPPAIDPRIDRACLEQELTPYVDAIGAGWPDAYRPTGTVLVSASGQTLYAQGFGTSDGESPNTERTSFRVGSVTKAFTAVAILQLAEQGQLTVDDAIGQHLPEYPAVGAGVTLHQLLSHTGGVPNYTDDPSVWGQRDQPLSPAELLATFWDQPLRFEPGTQYSYSNSGYAVLGAVIERVTGQTYAEYLQHAIFEPAGLQRTVVGDAEQLEERALGFSSDALGRRVPAFPIDMSRAYAAGAIRSTALDLVRWHAALSGDLLLDDGSREQMVTPVLDDYAYGWAVLEQEGVQVVRHSGGIDGFASDFVRVPELDLAIVVLLNADTVNPGLISDAALRCALGQDIPPEPPPALVELSEAQRGRLLGSYRIRDDAREQLLSAAFTAELIASLEMVAVYEEAGELVFQPVGQAAGVMLPLSEEFFYLPYAAATVQFSFQDDPALPALALTVEQAGLSLVFER